MAIYVNLGLSCHLDSRSPYLSRLSAFALEPATLGPKPYGSDYTHCIWT